MPGYLLYTWWLNIVPQFIISPPTCATVPDLVTRLYVMKHAFHVDRSCISNIVLLSHCCMPIQLVPRFGTKADVRLTSRNSMEWCREFFVNAYFDKDIFQYLQSSRP